MADSEQEGSVCDPFGIPVTPQAKRVGIEFPTYVSSYVWANYCITDGLPSRLEQTVDTRVAKLLIHMLEGLEAKSAVDEGFLWFPFKIWYHDRKQPRAKKQKRARLGARLFLTENGEPWIYVFDLKEAQDNGKPEEHRTHDREAQ